jgi:hypothetical protein
LKAAARDAQHANIHTDNAGDAKRVLERTVEVPPAVTLPLKLRLFSLPAWAASLQSKDRLALVLTVVQRVLFDLFGRELELSSLASGEADLGARVIGLQNLAAAAAALPVEEWPTVISDRLHAAVS